MKASSTPAPVLSWLLLEQYALGEVDEATRARIEAQLAHSEADRLALRSIREDQADLPALWPQPTAPRQDANDEVATVHTLPRPRARSWGAAGMLAAAAAVLLGVWGTQREAHDMQPPARRSWKGGELAVRVVNDRGGEATRFQAGMRLKLLISCPPSQAGRLQAAVFQGGQRFTPLPNDVHVPCGNNVAWPGAFAIDGREDADVCVAEAAAIAGARVPADLAEGVCVRLKAGP